VRARRGYHHFGLDRGTASFTPDEAVTLGRDLLGPIYHWFNEGFGTPDPKEAKALLDELG